MKTHPIKAVARRYRLFCWFLIALLPACWSRGQEPENRQSTQAMIVVQGAGGTEEYEAIFTASCQKLELAARQADAEFIWIGQPDTESPAASGESANPAAAQSANQPESLSNAPTDRDRLQQALKLQESGTTQLWIILIGHGTFDRQTAKFNLRGPDVSATELNEWLAPLQRPVAIIHGGSASAPFINQLSGKGRVIVTATKSGFEINYTRFGQYFAEALSNSAADIDKDDQVSLLEAFLFAARQVQEFYRSESRLATEHALIDDNGDGKGTPLEFFRGVRVVKQSSDDKLIPDGVTANQVHLIQSDFEKSLSEKDRQRRNQLEIQLEQLRGRKSELDEATYLNELEKISLELATFYRDVAARSEPDGKADRPVIEPPGPDDFEPALEQKLEQKADQ